MTRRETETGKWQDPWFRKLEPALKLGWLYLCDNCNDVGLVELDSALAEFCIGLAVPWESLLVASDNRLVLLADTTIRERRRYWVVPYFAFHHGTHTLSKSKLSHRPLIDALEKHKIEPGEFGYTINSQGLLLSNEFDLFWQEVHVKKAKHAARNAFDKAIKRLRSERSMTQSEAASYLIDRMKLFAASDEGHPTDHTPIHPATWLNQGRYDDDENDWNKQGLLKL